MPPATATRATIDDLYAVEGKTELVDGQVIRIPPDGDLPSQIALEIAVSLHDHARGCEAARVAIGSLVYEVSVLSSGRESFSPDVSYYLGPRPANPLRGMPGPPTFAVEVRSENDYGPAAAREMAAKRADYFEAGTLVVWDVDAVAEAIHVYRSTQPTEPTVYARGETAEAEPAVAGWRLAVAAIFG